MWFVRVRAPSEGILAGVKAPLFVEARNSSEVWVWSPERSLLRQQFPDHNPQSMSPDGEMYSEPDGPKRVTITVRDVYAPPGAWARPIKEVEDDTFLVEVYHNSAYVLWQYYPALVVVSPYTGQAWYNQYYLEAGIAERDDRYYDYTAGPVPNAALPWQVKLIEALRGPDVLS